MQSSFQVGFTLADLFPGQANTSRDGTSAQGSSIADIAASQANGQPLVARSLDVSGPPSELAFQAVFETVDAAPAGQQGMSDRIGQLAAGDATGTDPADRTFNKNALFQAIEAGDINIDDFIPPGTPLNDQVKAAIAMQSERIAAGGPSDASSVGADAGFPDIIEALQTLASAMPPRSDARQTVLAVQAQVTELQTTARAIEGPRVIAPSLLAQPDSASSDPRSETGPTLAIGAGTRPTVSDLLPAETDNPAPLERLNILPAGATPASLVQSVTEDVQSGPNAIEGTVSRLRANAPDLSGLPVALQGQLSAPLRAVTDALNLPGGTTPEVSQSPNSILDPFAQPTGTRQASPDDRISALPNRMSAAEIALPSQPDTAPLGQSFENRAATPSDGVMVNRVANAEGREVLTLVPQQTEGLRNPPALPLSTGATAQQARSLPQSDVTRDLAPNVVGAARGLAASEPVVNRLQTPLVSSVTAGSANQGTATTPLTDRISPEPDRLRAVLPLPLAQNSAASQPLTQTTQPAPQPLENRASLIDPITLRDGSTAQSVAPRAEESSAFPSIHQTRDALVGTTVQSAQATRAGNEAALKAMSLNGTTEVQQVATDDLRAQNVTEPLRPASDALDAAAAAAPTQPSLSALVRDLEQVRREAIRDIPSERSATTGSTTQDRVNSPPVTPTIAAPTTVTSQTALPLENATLDQTIPGADAFDPGFDTAPRDTRVAHALNTTSQPGGAAMTAAQAQPQQVMRQIAMAIQNVTGGTVEITLSPAELGSVRIGLTSAEGGMMVTIQAERPETLDLMRRNAELLADDFRDLGFEGTSFSFEGSDGRPPNLASQSDPSDMPGGLTRQADAASDADPTMTPAPITSDGAVDIRL